MNIFKIDAQSVISNNSIKILGNIISFNQIKLDRKDYFVGIRPEHLTLSVNNEFNFSPKIELIENLGNEKLYIWFLMIINYVLKISSDAEMSKLFKVSTKKPFVI